jgi:hypothetical protein
MSYVTSRIAHTLMLCFVLFFTHVRRARLCPRRIHSCITTITFLLLHYYSYITTHTLLLLHYYSYITTLTLLLLHYYSYITTLTSDAPDCAYGASPEIMYEGKPFKEVEWFRLVDKEMELVSRVTNTEIQRVRSGLSVTRDKCEKWNKDTKDKNQEQTGVRARQMLGTLATLEREAKQLGQDFLALEKFVNLNYQVCKNMSL